MKLLSKIKYFLSNKIDLSNSNFGNNQSVKHHSFKLKTLLVWFFLGTTFQFWAQISTVQPVKIIHKQDFVFKQMSLSPVAIRAQQQGIKPGAFKNVNYQYSNKVVILNKKKLLSLKQNLSSDGLIPIKSLQKIGLQPDKIYVSKDNDLIVKPMKLTKDTFALSRPKMRSVFKNLVIPNQNVPVTIANTSYTLKNTKVKSKEQGADYDMMMQFDNTLYKYDKEVKVKGKKTKVKIEVKLDGFVGFNNPQIEARLSKWDGYKLFYKATEHVDVKVSANMDFSQEISIPIWGYDVPISDIGSCKIGVFFVVDVNGKIKLEVHMQQHLDFTAGVKGKTAYYIPRNYHLIKEITPQTKIDYTLTAEVKGFAGVECTAEMNIKGYDLLKVNLRGGAELEVKTDYVANKLEAKIGLRLKMTGKLYKIDKKFTFFDKYFLIWERKEKDTGGFIMEVKNADAYHDRVWGSILRKQDSIAYVGKMKLIVKHANGKVNNYNGMTDTNGVFALTNISLIKNDKISIKIPASPTASTPISASIPFTEISLHYADYYTNRLEGNISTKLDLFPLKNQNDTATQSNQVSNANQAVNVIKNSGVISNTGIPQASVENKKLKKMFEAAITYKGKVDIIRQPTVLDAKLNLSPVNVKKAKKRTQRKKRPRKIPIIRRELIDNALTNFVLNDVDITPYQRVKIRLIIDGFVVESPWVISDGIVFIPSADVDKYGGVKSKNIGAKNTYVYISALRSGISPSGNIRVLKGIDMKHNNIKKQLPTQKITYPKLSIFKNAIHPLVYYDKTLKLKTLTGKYVLDQVKDLGKGASVVEIGPWKVANPYYDMKNVVKIGATDGHKFEYIGYKFDNKTIYYKYYQKTCAACKMPAYSKLKNINSLPHQIKKPLSKIHY